MEAFVLKTVEIMAKSIWHSKWYIVFGVLLSVGLSLIMDRGVIAKALRRAGGFGVFGSAGLAALTPLCSCSQVPLIAGVLAAGVPWSTVMPFLIASPMISPVSMALIAGYLGVRFAAVHAVTVVALGLVAGLVVMAGERSGWLADQSRLASGPAPTQARRATAGGPGAEADRKTATASACGCDCGSDGNVRPAPKTSPSGTIKFLGRVWQLILARGWSVLKVLVIMGLIGGAFSQLVPSSVIIRWLGAGSSYSVPIAALAGLPLLINNAQALPLLAELAQKGLSAGAALAFLMTGPGTCASAFAAAWTLAKPRMFGLYLALLLVFPIVAGVVYNIVLGGAF